MVTSGGTGGEGLGCIELGAAKAVTGKGSSEGPG